MPSSVTSRKPARPVDPALVTAMVDAGQRMTRNRATVLEVLAAAARPLTADEVARLAKAPLSTAYRNLTELCDAGVCVRVGGAGRTDRYEISEQFTSHHHHHLICIECGSVTDFDPSSGLEKVINLELQLLARQGFRPTHHVFDVQGVCAACASLSE